MLCPAQALESLGYVSRTEYSQNVRSQCRQRRSAMGRRHSDEHIMHFHSSGLTMIRLQYTSRVTTIQITERTECLLYHKSA